MGDDVRLGVGLGLGGHRVVTDFIAVDVHYLHAAEGVADGHIGALTALHNEREAGVVQRLETLYNVAVLPVGDLMLLILRSAGRADDAGVHLGEHFDEDLFVTLDASADKPVVDKGGEAVRDSVLKRGGGVGHARDEGHVCKRGVLTEVGLRIGLLAHVLGFGVGGQFNAGDLALGVYRKGEFNGLLGVALGGGQAQDVAHAAGLAVDALHARGDVRQRGAAGIGRVVELVKACGVGHDGVERGKGRRAAVFGDERSGDEIQPGQQQDCDEDYGDKRQHRFGEFFFIFHF